MPEPAPDPLAVTSAFDLGTPRELTFVASTLASHIWKLETDRGRWAIKEHAWRFEHERDRAVFDLENAAVRAGVPLPPPVPAADGRANSGVPNAEGAIVTVRVWPWVDLVKIETPTDDTTLEALGAALARLHSLEVDVEPAPLHSYYWQPPEDEVWSTLTKKVRATKVPWADAFEEHVPQARKLAALARDHPPTDTSAFSAWCHFDLTRNNCQLDGGARWSFSTGTTPGRAIPAATSAGRSQPGASRIPLEPLSTAMRGTVVLGASMPSRRSRSPPASRVGG